MKATLINDDFADFIKEYGDHYNLPEYGQTYEVRGESKSGGILLVGITNPFFLINTNPLLFEELHFQKSRFILHDGRNDGEPDTVRPAELHRKD